MNDAYNMKKQIPLFLSSVQAGFPSPAEDYIDRRINLDRLLIKHPASTFFVKVKGTSMVKAGIHDNDLLIVDRSLYPKNGSIVIAIIDNEFTIKRISITNKKIYLLPENDEFKPIEIKSETDFQIWGVVTYVIHSLQD